MVGDQLTSYCTMCFLVFREHMPHLPRSALWEKNKKHEKKRIMLIWAEYMLLIIRLRFKAYYESAIIHLRWHAATVLDVLIKFHQFRKASHRLQCTMGSNCRFNSWTLSRGSCPALNHTRVRKTEPSGKTSFSTLANWEQCEKERNPQKFCYIFFR